LWIPVRRAENHVALHLHHDAMAFFEDVIRGMQIDYERGNFHPGTDRFRLLIGISIAPAEDFRRRSSVRSLTDSHSVSGFFGIYRRSTSPPNRHPNPVVAAKQFRCPLGPVRVTSSCRTSVFQLNTSGRFSTKALVLARARCTSGPG